MRLLGPPFSDAEREAFCAAMIARVGLPWLHQGRTERGADCIGHVWLAMRAVRPDVPAPRTDYGRTPHNRKLREGLRDYFGEPVTDLRIGDVVSLRVAGPEHHVGVLVPHPDYPLGLVHGDSNAPGTAGMRVVYHGLNPRWRSRIVEGWRP